MGCVDATSLGISGGKTSPRCEGGEAGGIYPGIGQTGFPPAGDGGGRSGREDAYRRRVSRPVHPAEHFQTDRPDDRPDGPRGGEGLFEGGHGAHRRPFSFNL